MNQDLVACPVCQGTGRMPATDVKDYAKQRGWYGYSAEDDTCHCRNCGAQTMSGVSTGLTRRRKDTGLPCQHEVVGQTRGRCYVRYTCQHCDYTYDIDSSD
jgi:hypothetical protein